MWQEGGAAGFVPRTMMNLSSSFDHRVVDGARASEFLLGVIAGLESPTSEP